MSIKVPGMPDVQGELKTFRDDLHAMRQKMEQLDDLPAIRQHLARLVELEEAKR